METLQSLQSNKVNRSWVAVGAFDGVHLGHQSIFRHLVDGAHQSGCEAVVITFDPLPAVFFQHLKTGFALTTLLERQELIKAVGVDRVVTLNFDQELADVSAPDFMKSLKESLGLEKLLAGFNFTLGKDRAGNVSELKEIGQTLGYEVEVQEPIKVNNEIISSSNIRQLLHKGNIRKANEFLGRPYSLIGEVVHGEHRGGKLGIPTANLSIPAERLLPPNGVYVTRAHVGEKTYQSVTNIGVRPTFDNPLLLPRVEPHLLDSEAHLYGETLKLEFIEYLRPELKFPDGQALVAQINLDIQKTREVLADEA